MIKAKPINNLFVDAPASVSVYTEQLPSVMSKLTGNLIDDKPRLPVPDTFNFATIATKEKLV